MQVAAHRQGEFHAQVSGDAFRELGAIPGDVSVTGVAPRESSGNGVTKVDADEKHWWRPTHLQIAVSSPGRIIVFRTNLVGLEELSGPADGSRLTGRVEHHVQADRNGGCAAKPVEVPRPRRVVEPDRARVGRHARIMAARPAAARTTKPHLRLFISNSSSGKPSAISFQPSAKRAIYLTPLDPTCSVGSDERGLSANAPGVRTAFQDRGGLSGIPVRPALAGRLGLSPLRRPAGMVGAARLVAVRGLRLRGFGHGRDDLPGQPSAPVHMVAGDLACGEPEERDQCPGLQRVLGLGSYKTAWGMLHKLRRAMVRPGRDRLRGVVEVDETYWGSEEPGVAGRLTHDKALVIVAAEEDGRGIGRVRLRRIRDARPSLHGFIGQSVEPGSTVRTDGWDAYLGLRGYTHDRQVQRHRPEGEHLLPRVHRVVSLLKRWLLGTHQGAIGQEHLDYYLDEFTFRFNRRKSASRGKLFYRLVEQAVQVEPVPFDTLIHPLPLGGGGVK